MFLLFFYPFIYSIHYLFIFNFIIIFINIIIVIIIYLDKNTKIGVIFLNSLEKKVRRYMCKWVIGSVKSLNFFGEKIKVEFDGNQVLIIME